ncbi:family 43 glycosylhydrolase, partial [Microbacterium testaceum]|uniref:family 43 glycosylhydrolase n=1 Tax=Microbacterium testaceum TaxID=2033 RepID=UPI0022E0ABAF
MRSRRPAALALAAALVGGGLVTGIAPAQAAPPTAALLYDFDALPLGTAAAGTAVADGAGAHPGTVRGAGASIVAGPRGGSDHALALPGGAAGSGAAFVEMAPGLTDATTGDVTISAWIKWSGGQDCAWAYSLGSSADRYLFATPQCGGTLIGAVKANGEQRAADDGPASATRWSHVAVALQSGQRVTTYVDGVAVASTATNATGAATVGTATFSGLVGKSLYGADPLFAGAIDDVRVDRAALSAAQIADIAAPAAGVIARQDADAVDLGDTSAVTSDLSLPRTGAGGSTLTWTSSNPDVVSEDGRVVRPAPGSADAVVTLVPTASFAGSTATGTPVRITVTADSAAELSARLTSTLVVPPVVASGTALPTVPGVDLRWSGDTVADGALVNTGDATRTASVTAAATWGDTTFSKTFTVSVLDAATGQNLVAYTRTPTDDHDANQDSVARSIHFAVGSTADQAQPLQNNYGVVFAKGEHVGVDNVDQRGIAAPSPFYFADGRLGFITTRVFLSGVPDATARSGATIYRAADDRGAQFDELGTIDLGTTGGVSAPRAVWDSGQKRYVVSWTDDNGAAQRTTVVDLARTELVADPFNPENEGRRSRIVVDGNRGEVSAGALSTVAAPSLSAFGARVANAEPSGSLPVGGALAAALSQRYNRVVNTAASVAPATVKAGETSGLAATKVDLSYTDGSTATLPVDWKAEDLAAVAGAKSGTYTVSGTVRQKDYSVPFTANRADPTIYRYERDGKTQYLFIATDDLNNNNIASAHLPIRVSDTFEGLSDAAGGAQREVDLLNRLTKRDTTTDGRTIAGCYWAPEIHEIGGKLSILFSPCFNSGNPQANDGGDWQTVQSHIMQLRDGGDPANPADWSKPAAVLKADGSPLGRDGYRNISLDMTYFEANGQAYYTWSQRYTSPGFGDPLTWIAKVDPQNPARIVGEAKPVISPSLSWELRLAEGSFAMERDGKIYLVYSSDGVSPRYVVGGVWADLDSDLMDIDSWHKYTTPLMKSVPMPAGVWDYLTYPQGPGHGAVTTDDDGNELYVYHTWGDGVAGNGRDTRIGRIHWAAGDRPVLDMSKDEEVLPALRTVTMSVTVTPTGGPTPTPTTTPQPTATPTTTPQPTATPTTTPQPTATPTTTPQPTATPTTTPQPTATPTASAQPTPGTTGAPAATTATAT